MVRIIDIARKAQVSQGTVSFVLNGRAEEMRISPATCERVLEAAKSLGYRPNTTARRLRQSIGSQRYLIALYWDKQVTSSLLGHFLTGVESLLIELGGGAEILVKPYIRGQLYLDDNLTRPSLFDGAIVTTPAEADIAFLEQAELSMPVILYNHHSNKVNSVYSDGYESGAQIAQLFKARKQKKVAVVVPDGDSRNFPDRLQGFLQVADQSGLSVDQKRIAHAPGDMSGGRQATQMILADGHVPDAIYYMLDDMAFGGLTVLNKLGLRMPEDLVVVGHGDLEPSAYSIPSLTSMHLPREEMAEASLELMLKLLHNEVVGPVNRVFHTSIVYRESCGPAPS